ncbi:ComEC/Rec2 family competence protein [Oscillospiraceae bacterium MB08-C2-2]|nr:ComEC/Rec2 family competence protein [Oscillospiraceae bacterium MB08-C2-2]
MKRPLYTAGLVFLPVMWAAFFIDWQDALLLSGALAIAGVLMGLTRRQELRVVCLCLFSGAVALGAYAGYVVGTIEPVEALAGQEVEAIGVVTRVDYYSSTSYYEIKAHFPAYPQLPATQVRIGCVDQLRIQPGQGIRIRFIPELSRERPNATRYQARGVLVQDFVSAAQVERAQPPFPVTAWFLRIREHLAEKLSPLMTVEGGQVISTMVLGTTGMVSADLSTAFNRTGTTHLLSISGMHLSILIAAAQRLLEKLRLPRRAVSLLCMGVILGYAALVGFSAAVLRSASMWLIMLLGPVLSRRSDGLNSLGCACIFLCILRPYWALSMGLWLSAVSTWGILLVGSKWSDRLYNRLKGKDVLRNRFLKAMVAPVMISVSAALFTMPLQVAMSGYVSLVSPLTNLLVTPFVGISVVAGLLAAFLPLPLAKPVAWAADFAVSMIDEIARLFAKAPGAVWPLNQRYLLVWVAAAGVAVLLVRVCKGGRKAWLVSGALCVIALCIGSIFHTTMRQNKVELVTLENINTAVLIRGKQAVLLGAPQKYDGTRLVEYLTFRGIDQVDALVAWDSTALMNSGLTRVCEDFPVDFVIGPHDPVVLAALSTACRADAYTAQGLSMEVLGGVVLRPLPEQEGLFIAAGQEIYFQSPKEYAILEKDPPPYSGTLFREGVAVKYRDGQAFLPRKEFFYGETRLILESSP